ncbi:MAG: acyltransferase [Chitinispirillaceae bacterium]|nr:acyltransferase [Chitinispirillaceae bacterium]
MIKLLQYCTPVFCYCIALFTARLAVKHRAFGFLQNRKNRFGALDGLRGILAFSVYMHHAFITWEWKQTGKWAAPSELFVNNLGKVGVFLFFIITGFLFTSKLLNNKSGIKWGSLFKSRFFRIYPLYIFETVVISLIAFTEFNFQLRVDTCTLVKEYFEWLVFSKTTLNGSHSPCLINASVDWTLRYECIFYLSLPLIYATIKWLKMPGGIVLVLVSVVLTIKPLSFHSVHSQYFILFCIGGVVAWGYKRYTIVEKWISSTHVSAFTLVLFISALFIGEKFRIFQLLLISGVFFWVVYGNTIFGFLATPANVLLGEISYSTYLLHGIVLYILFTWLKVVDIATISYSTYLLLWLPLTSVLVVIISLLSYLFVEKPGMALGRKAILRRDNHS